MTRDALSPAQIIAGKEEEEEEERRRKKKRRKNGAGQEAISSPAPALHNPLLFLHSWFLKTFSPTLPAPNSIFLLTGLLVDILLRDWSHQLLSPVMVNFLFLPPPKSPWEVQGLKRAGGRGRRRPSFKVPLLCFTKVSVDTIGRTLLHKMDRKSSMSKPTHAT